VNSLKVRIGRLEEWLGYAQPDIVCLQETKLADAAFPGMSVAQIGYEWAHHGNGRWNGVAILSKVGLEDVRTGFDDGLDDEGSESRAITASCGGIQVTSVYVPNGRSPADAQYELKLRWLDRLATFIDTKASPLEPVAVCGDFNIAPTDADVYNPKAFVGATHVSSQERKRLQALEEWGLVDVFRRIWPQEKLYSWWDYRAGNFHKHLGMRIDLILLTEVLAEAATFALVDRNARKGESPSDHAPLFVDV